VETDEKTKRAEELAVQRTKRSVAKEGMKALPKKFGEKIRHRDSKVGKLNKLKNRKKKPGRK
jgi:3-methyladenine DNA glycosylase AlkC